MHHSFYLDSIFAQRWDRVHEDIVSSTHLHAKNFLDIHSQLVIPTWFTAKQQNAGRGRMGRDWQTAYGNIAASLAINLPVALREISTLPLVMGLAVHQVISQLLPQKKINLKWPNDVHIDAKKVSGILVETVKTWNENSYDQTDFNAKLTKKPNCSIILSCGINLIHAPNSSDIRATSLIKHGVVTPYDKIFNMLEISLKSYLSKWLNSGFNSLLEDWNHASYPIGTTFETTINCAKQRVIYKGIRSSGMCIVDTLEGKRIELITGELI